MSEFEVEQTKQELSVNGTISARLDSVVSGSSLLCWWS